MLEITKEINKYGHEEFVLKLNGRIVSEDIRLENDDDNNKFIINFYEIDSCECVYDIISDDLDFLISTCSKIEFVVPQDIYIKNDNFIHDYAVLKLNQDKVLELKIGIKINLPAWKNEWSGKVHLLEFKKVLDSLHYDSMTWDGWTDDESKIYSDDFWDTWLVFNFDGCVSSVKDELSSALNLICKTHDRVSTNLLARFGKSYRSVLTEFEFPDEIKISCEQYLLFFIKFLKDIGIDATANIHETDAGKVLFAVTPKDEEQALSHIRAALEIYLNLPRNTSITPFGVYADLSVQQLVSNIYHLKSQLALAAATIQQKEF